jgi:hypothetical protein
MDRRPGFVSRMGLAATVARPTPAYRRSGTVHDVVNGGTMMWGMSIIWILIIVAVALGIAALVKFLFFR